MAARHLHFREELFQLAISRGQLSRRHQIARGRVRVGESKALALGGFDRGDAAVLARETDRVIAGRTIDVLRGQLDVHGSGVGQIDLGISRRTQTSEVYGAAQKALDHAIIVGRGEDFDGNAQCRFNFSTEALVRGQTVLGVFTAQDADVEFFDRILRQSGRCQNGGSSENGEQLFHRSLHSLAKRAGVELRPASFRHKPHRLEWRWRWRFR